MVVSLIARTRLSELRAGWRLSLASAAAQSDELARAAAAEDRTAEACHLSMKFQTPLKLSERNFKPAI